MVAILKEHSEANLILFQNADFIINHQNNDDKKGKQFPCDNFFILFFLNINIGFQIHARCKLHSIMHFNEKLKIEFKP